MACSFRVRRGNVVDSVEELQKVLKEQKI